MSEISERAHKLIMDYGSASMVLGDDLSTKDDVQYRNEARESLADYIATLEAEVEALLAYRDGYDPKVTPPDKGVWVIMRDCDDNYFEVQYDPELGWYFNFDGTGDLNWYESDFDFVRWYPEAPLPEVRQ